MSRTVRNRHMRGRFWLPDLEREKAKYRNRGYSEERIEHYTAYDKKYLNRFHRDGFITTYTKPIKKYGTRQVRRDMSKYLYHADWDGTVVPCAPDLSWDYD